MSVMTVHGMAVREALSQNYRVTAADREYLVEGDSVGENKAECERGRCGEGDDSTSNAAYRVDGT